VAVKGNKLVDQHGNLVVLRGVSHSGSEYTCIHSSGVFEGKARITSASLLLIPAVIPAVDP